MHGFINRSFVTADISFFCRITATILLMKALRKLTVIHGEFA